ncbi:MAG: glycoside hydrolase family 127 protein [Chloroflexota bacterium]|nr:glycoside hydrolase family 127 protein [Chloroflexota bacterium]
MAVQSSAAAGAVDNRRSPSARWRTLPSRAVTILDGFWSNWQVRNRDVSLLHGLRMLEQWGNLDNLRIAAGQSQGQFRGPVFMDSDLYKWLEAVAFEMMREPSGDWVSRVSPIIELIEAAQQPDGYLDSYYQVAEPGRRWTDFTHGHEMYCAGHLAQAAVAWHRATGDERLLRVAVRLADHIDARFGPGRREATPGHPQVEMALVELYRETGESRYLRLAQALVDRRGRGLLTGGRFSSAYYQDRVPVREAVAIEGHAVRALYLACGVADLYMEDGEATLLEALQRQWQDMVSGKLYITGGLGARHSGESFGQPYELPNEVAYCETCAAIGSLMWNWRLALVTREARFGDEIERALFNAFLSGVSLTGDRFFYVNPLLSRGREEVLGRTAAQRLEWWRVACCPPNVMRTLASLAHYFASTDERGMQIHQYANATMTVRLESGGSVRLTMSTNYPWDGRITLGVDETPDQPWELALRVPGWAPSATLAINGEQATPPQPSTYAGLERTWRVGDRVELTLEMRPRLIAANPWLEGSRRYLAIQRGPLVYCLEQVDQHCGLFDLELDTSAALEPTSRPDLLDGVMTIQAAGRAVDNRSWQERLYRPLDELPARASSPVTVVALPYYAWANRGASAMRVWIPEHSDRA